MTLEETIKFLKEFITDNTHELSCEKYKQDSIQLLVWLEDYKSLLIFYPEAEKHIDNLEEASRLLLKSTLTLGDKCDSLEIENKELKRLLRLAVRDIGKMKSCEEFPFCVGCPKENEPYCKWKHNDEAMKLIGGAENAN
jgi:hypothetical protein